MLCKVTIEYVCSACDARHTDSFDVPFLGAGLPTPTTPSGWQNLNGLAYCPAHRIEIKPADGPVSGTGNP